MKNLAFVIAAFTFVSSLCAREAKDTVALLNKGLALSAKDSEKLEERLKKKPNDEEARIQLLSYYTSLPAGADLSTVKAARSAHIYWLIANDPKDGLGLFQVLTGVYKLHCVGDELADPAAAQRATELWVEQVRKNPGNAAIRLKAVQVIQYCSPEQAELLLTEANDRAGLGQLYALAFLGITGESYLNNELTGSDAAFRERPFARKARLELEQAIDKDLLPAAATTLLRQGAILWADGKLDWDYTSMGKDLLSKALAVAPEALGLLTLPIAPPARGERPPFTIRIGGNVQQSKLLQKVTPPYPPAARDLGVQGTVKLMALIGLDGRIVHLHAEGGPPQLIPGSLEAVRQWVYQPTLMNGKPCYVITQIDLNYTLSPPL